MSGILCLLICPKCIISDPLSIHRAVDNNGERLIDSTALRTIRDYIIIAACARQTDRQKTGQTELHRERHRIVCEL